MSHAPHGFHAHVYFDATDKDSADAAMELRMAVARDLPRVAIGRWHAKPVGPHPMGSYQLDFSPAREAETVGYLKANSRGLSILLHTETGDHLHDHTDGTAWIGAPKDLDLSIFNHA
ncbi:MAG: DOPA 4,5-dioxygenase family protein [Alphaproteobacteria bacterium]